MPGITPSNVGDLKPGDLMAAIGIFDVKYPSE